MITTFLILIILLALLLIWAHKVDKAINNYGKYVFKSEWLNLTIIIEENSKDGHTEGKNGSDG